MNLDAWGRFHKTVAYKLQINSTKINNWLTVGNYSWLKNFIVLATCRSQKCQNKILDHGGGLVVSIRAFYSDDPSSNPAGYLNFLYKKTKMNEKEAGQGLADLKKNTKRNITDV